MTPEAAAAVPLAFCAAAAYGASDFIGGWLSKRTSAWAVACMSQATAALGTVMRTATVRDCAREAGYAGVDVLPVENEFFRLYRLHP